MTKLTNRQAIVVLDGLWSNPLFGKAHRQAFEIGIKAIKALEQEPCEELDFVQPHKKVSVNLEVCKMREATQEEREGVEQYINSIAKPYEDAQSKEDIAKAFQFGLAFGFGKRYDEMDRVMDEIKKVITPQPKMGCEGCTYEKTGNNSTYPCSHCSRCYTDKYKAEGSEE